MKTKTVKYKIAKLDKHDIKSFQKLIQMFHEVFETGQKEQAKKSHLNKLLKNHHFIALAALDGKEVIGGLTAYILPQYYSANPEMYIYDMAVKSNMQRKGMGKELVKVLKKYCQQNKIKVMFVEAHAKDKHAVNFYRSTGGKQEEVVHFNYFIKNHIRVSK